jgi:hypothetical protein
MCVRVCGARGGAGQADSRMGAAGEDSRAQGCGGVHVALRMELHFGGSLGREASGRMAACCGAKTHCQVESPSLHHENVISCKFWRVLVEYQPFMYVAGILQMR